MAIDTVSQVPPRTHSWLSRETRLPIENFGRIFVGIDHASQSHRDPHPGKHARPECLADTFQEIEKFCRDMGCIEWLMGVSCRMHESSYKNRKLPYISEDAEDLETGRPLQPRFALGDVHGQRHEPTAETRAATEP